MTGAKVAALAAAVLAAGGGAAAGLAVGTDDPIQGSRRAVAVDYLQNAMNWMHTSKKKGGLGFSIAHIQRTDVYRAAVVMGGVWPTTVTVSTSIPAAATVALPPLPTNCTPTAATPTTTAAAVPVPGSGAGAGNGQGGGR